MLRHLKTYLATFGPVMLMLTMAVLFLSDIVTVLPSFQSICDLEVSGYPPHIPRVGNVQR